MKAYDFVILGAGSAGCVLANRLSANPDFNVCLVEAGSKDTDIRLHVPLGFAFLGDKSKYSWAYNTEPQKEFAKVTILEPKTAVVETMHSCFRFRGYHHNGRRNRRKRLHHHCTIPRNQISI